MAERSARFVHLYSRALTGVGSNLWSELTEALEDAVSSEPYRLDLMDISNRLRGIEDPCAPTVFAQICYYLTIAANPLIFSDLVHSCIMNYAFVGSEMIAHVHNSLVYSDNIALVTLAAETDAAQRYLIDWFVSLPVTATSKLAVSLLSNRLIGISMYEAIREGAPWLANYLEAFNNLTVLQQSFVQSVYDFFKNEGFRFEEIIAGLVPYLADLPSDESLPRSVDEAPLPSEVTNLREAISTVFSQLERSRALNFCACPHDRYYE
ncbi:hypothetical protein Gasu2_34210 [Galdieria sulphuraria]|nr:hypothetical protein Gasu2_34210 [Galdieria sulphuraria]